MAVCVVFKGVYRARAINKNNRLQFYLKTTSLQKQKCGKKIISNS